MAVDTGDIRHHNLISATAESLTNHTKSLDIVDTNSTVIDHQSMKYILILQCLMLSLPSFSQEWGTVFPSEKEMAELDKKMSDRKIIVQNSYYPISGKFDEVLALRIAASKFLKEFGFSPGRVLVQRQTMDRSKGKEEEIASILWLSEYESLESLKREMNSWTPAQENRFQKEILSKMKLLIHRFRRTSSYVVY